MATSSVFHFPIQTLSNERVKLVPFDPEHHIDTFFRLSEPHPELYAHMSHGLFPSAAKLKAEFYERGNKHSISFTNPDTFAFAIIDKMRPPSADDPEGELAGTVSYSYTSAEHHRDWVYHYSPALSREPCSDQCSRTCLELCPE
jgi:hypothetical protein